MIKIISRWSILKWIRFVLAGFVLVYGIITIDWLLIAAGVFLLYMIVFNKGCIGGACEVPGKEPNEKS